MNDTVYCIIALKCEGFHRTAPLPAEKHINNVKSRAIDIAAGMCYVFLAGRSGSASTPVPAADARPLEESP